MLTLKSILIYLQTLKCENETDRNVIVHIQTLKFKKDCHRNRYILDRKWWKKNRNA